MNKGITVLILIGLFACSYFLGAFAESAKPKAAKTATVKKAESGTLKEVKKPAQPSEKKETKKPSETVKKAPAKAETTKEAKASQATKTTEKAQAKKAAETGKPATPAAKKEPPKLTIRDAQKFFNEGVRLFKKKAYGSAAGNFDKAIEANPGFVKAYSLRGFCNYFLDNYSKALADLNVAVQFDPENVTALFGRGVTHIALGKTREAIADFTSVLEHQPTNAQSYLERGICHFRLGNLSQAINDASRSISGNPRKAAPFVLRGVCYWKEEKFEPAVRDFKMAVEIEPKNVYYHLLQYTARARGGDKDAAKDLREFLDDRKSMESAYPYSLAAMMLGRKSPPECLKAAEIYEPARMRGTVLQQTQFFVAQFFEIQGDKEKAQKYMDLAMKGENNIFLIQPIVKLQYYELK
jgi:tetratricopeptide (TPR) repeat protein